MMVQKIKIITKLEVCKPSLYDREKFVTTSEALGKLLTTTSTYAKNSIDLSRKSSLVFIQTLLRGPEAKVTTFA